MLKTSFKFDNETTEIKKHLAATRAFYQIRLSRMIAQPFCLVKCGG